MIDPASIDLSVLPWVPLDATASFPAQPGIYFAIDSEGVVQYVGRSGNVRNRWRNHHRYDDLVKIGGVRIVYLFVNAPDLLPQIEKALIEWFNPPLNTIGKQKPLRLKIKRPKAYSQKKTERFQVLFTASGLEMLNKLAKRFKSSRSDLLEQMTRALYATEDEVLIKAFLERSKVEGSDR